jgi:hypothetical protein
MGIGNELLGPGSTGATVGTGGGVVAGIEGEGGATTDGVPGVPFVFAAGAIGVVPEGEGAPVSVA